MKQDEYYDFELEGCEVWLINGNEESSVRVQSVLKTGGTEILLIATPMTAAKLLVSTGRDRSLIEIDIIGKEIVIDPPEGLLELS